MGLWPATGYRRYPPGLRHALHPTARPEGERLVPELRTECQGVAGRERGELANKRIRCGDVAHRTATEALSVINPDSPSTSLEVWLIPGPVICFEEQAKRLLHLVCVCDQVDLVATFREAAGEPVCG